MNYKWYSPVSQCMACLSCLSTHTGLSTPRRSGLNGGRSCPSMGRSCPLSLAGWARKFVPKRPSSSDADPFRTRAERTLVDWSRDAVEGKHLAFAVLPSSSLASSDRLFRPRNIAGNQNGNRNSCASAEGGVKGGEKGGRRQEEDAATSHSQSHWLPDLQATAYPLRRGAAALVGGVAAEIPFWVEYTARDGDPRPATHAPGAWRLHSRMRVDTTAP